MENLENKVKNQKTAQNEEQKDYLVRIAEESKNINATYKFAHEGHSYSYSYDGTVDQLE